jgi:hypothetical protein
LTVIAHFPLLTLLVFWFLVHAVTEWAWRVGRRRGAARDERVSVEPATALLAVLGLLLAFSVSMAVERYDAREQLVIEEANAIGSAELRAHFLPDTARTRSRALFEHYLDRRLRWSEGARDEATQERLLWEAGDDQNQLWQIAVESGTSSPTPVFALYESGLDQMIDVAARRAHVRSNRIPAPVLWLLIAITLLANGLFAAVLGHNKKRDTLDLHLLAFATWLVVALVADLDGPRHGLVQISQEPFRRLQQAWRTASLSQTQLTDFGTRYAAAWSSQNPDILTAFYAESGSLQVNAGAPSVGRAAIRATAQGYMSAFPDMIVRMDSVVRAGPREIFHWTWTGTNTGPGGTGKAVRISGYEEWSIGSDGLISQSLGHFDEAEYQRQVARALP